MLKFRRTAAILIICEFWDYKSNWAISNQLSVEIGTMAKNILINCNFMTVIWKSSMKMHLIFCAFQKIDEIRIRNNHGLIAFESNCFKALKRIAKFTLDNSPFNPLSTNIFKYFNKSLHSFGLSYVGLVPTLGYTAFTATIVIYNYREFNN